MGIAAPAVRTIAAPVAAVRAAPIAAPAVRTIAAPVAAVRSAAPSITSSQYHSQDEDKNFSFGYSNINSARQESGNANLGVVQGSYTDGKTPSTMLLTPMVTVQQLFKQAQHEINCYRKMKATTHFPIITICWILNILYLAVTALQVVNVTMK